jgi:preprotein translocase subunit SecA
MEQTLLGIAHKHYPGARLAAELEGHVEKAFGPAGSGPKFVAPPPDPAGLAGLAAWAREQLGVEVGAAELGAKGRREARAMLVNALDARHRPEMREMEKVLLLQIVDSSWMEHLRAMDHLRSSIGLQGYAQIDPKVEYKREGMKIFSEMWAGVSDKVTDLVFRVEQFDPEFLSYLGARWQLDRAQTIHQSAPSELATAAAPKSQVQMQQEAGIAASQQTAEKKHEPVRNVGKKVGRNDPCPCGSGKKFKACCMRKEASSDIF